MRRGDRRSTFPHRVQGKRCARVSVVCPAVGEGVTQGAEVQRQCRETPMKRSRTHASQFAAWCPSTSSASELRLLETESRSLIHLISRDGANLTCRAVAHNYNISVARCTIVTMPTAAPTIELHDGRPAILVSDTYDAWLVPQSLPLKSIRCSSIAVRTASSNSTASTGP